MSPDRRDPTVLTMESAETYPSWGKSRQDLKKRALKYSRRIVWQKLSLTITVRSESKGNLSFAIRQETLSTCQAGLPLAFAVVAIRKISLSATAPIGRPGFNQKYKPGLYRPPLPSPRYKSSLRAAQPFVAEKPANGHGVGRSFALPIRPLTDLARLPLFGDWAWAAIPGRGCRRETCSQGLGVR